MLSSQKVAARVRRKARIRKKIAGTAERPRLTVYRSLKNFHAQIVDDLSGKTLLGSSTLAEPFTNKKNAGNVKGAHELGVMVAKLALTKDIKQVVFDRGGFDYHGRVKAFADGAREGGLKF